MLTWMLFLLAGLCLPLFPLSMGVNWLLQQASDGRFPQLARPGLRITLVLVLPLLGVGLLSLGMATAGDDAPALLTGFAVWGGASSVFYGFRLLSARDGRIWAAQLYSSALALVWVGAANGVAPLAPTLGLVLALLPLLFLFEQLRQRFGIARAGLFPGLAEPMPRFSTLFVLAVLVAVGVPPLSPAFYALAQLAFTGEARLEFIVLLPVGLSWLLWTWAGLNLLTGIVFGAPRVDLTYVDLGREDVVRLGLALLALAVFGVMMIEEVL